jgi:hypothetical protein
MNKWRWFKIFTILCLALSAILPAFGENGLLTIVLIPFIHTGINFIYLFILRVKQFSSGSVYEEHYYIKENYPKLWKTMHPWGDHSRNSFGYFSFMRYQTEDPILLNLIDELKDQTKWILSVFCLTPVIWFISVCFFILYAKIS